MLCHTALRGNIPQDSISHLRLKLLPNPSTHEEAVSNIAVRFLAAIAAVSVAMPGHAQMAGGMDYAPSMPERADPTIPFQNGVEALNAGQYDKAIRELLKARNARPGEPQINSALGLAYQGAGRKADAKRAFQRAVRARNAPTSALLNLGLVALELGDRATAEAQQTGLDTKLAGCTGSCTASDIAEIKAAQEKLSAALAAQ